jgi:hypothetical protein
VSLLRQIPVILLCVAAATANNHRCWYLWHVRRYDGSPWEKRHAQRDQRFFYYHRQSWRRPGSFGAVDAELCFSKRCRAMSSVGQTTIPDPGRTWCYRRCGSAHPNHGSDIASGLGLRNSTTFLACTSLAPAPRRGFFLRSVRHRAAPQAFSLSHDSIARHTSGKVSCFGFSLSFFEAVGSSFENLTNCLAMYSPPGNEWSR